MKIFLITTFETMLPKDEYGFLKTGARRSVGYYADFESAKRVVENNVLDLWETIYDYIAIEELNEGLYPYADNKWFYKYNVNTNRYEQINAPKEYEKCFMGEVG